MVEGDKEWLSFDFHRLNKYLNECAFIGVVCNR